MVARKGERRGGETQGEALSEVEGRVANMAAGGGVAKAAWRVEGGRGEV